MMSVHSHSATPGPGAAPRTWRLEEAALAWTEGSRSGRLPYAEVARVHTYRLDGPWGAGTRIVLTPRRGRKLRITSMHRAGGILGADVERAGSFRPFARGLAERIAAANPAADVTAGAVWAPSRPAVMLLTLGFLLIAAMLGAVLAGRLPTAGLPVLVALCHAVPAGFHLVRPEPPRRIDIRDLPAVFGAA